MEIKPGNVALVSSWEPHAWHMTAPNTVALVVYFVPEFLGDVYFDGLHWLSLFAADPARRPRARTKEARQRLLAIGQEIRTSASGRVAQGEPPSLTAWGLGSRPGSITTWILNPSAKDRPPAWEATVRLWLTRILLILYQDWEHRQESLERSQTEKGYLGQILPALMLGVDGDGRMARVTLDEAAAACGLSVTRFRSLFRSTMGLSFGRFELRRRLALAARLLVTTNESVQSIAEHCGFTDRSHLLRMFRRRYGRTPAGFRREGGSTIE